MQEVTQEQIEKANPKRKKGRLGQNHELSVTMIFTPASNREKREVSRRINLQALHAIHLDEARLEFNYKKYYLFEFLFV